VEVLQASQLCVLLYRHECGSSTEHVELVGEHTVLLDWKDTGYTIRDNIDMMWENIRKGLKESDKIIYV
jgi:hypothetical protein